MFASISLSQVPMQEDAFPEVQPPRLARFMPAGSLHVGLIELHRAEQFGVENKLHVALVYLVPLDTKNPVDEME